MRNLGSLAFHIDSVMKNKTKYARFVVVVVVVVVVFVMQFSL